MTVQSTDSIFYTSIVLILWSFAYGLQEDSTPAEIIKENGYPAETHLVHTTHLHFSRLHRIPYGKAATNNNSVVPILLLHGLFSSSKDWIINGPGRSLAYSLADENYDVWMANARGNEYASGRAESRNYKEEWDFSFHEIGTEDLPVVIDYILNVTKRPKLVCVAHSLGTTALFILLSEMPEYNEKIQFQINFAPIAALEHTTSDFRTLIPFIQDLQEKEYYGGIHNNSMILRFLTRWMLCPDSYLNDTNACAEELIAKLFGSNPDQFDKAMIPTIIHYAFSGTSLKNCFHLSQFVKRAGKFSRAEYTEEEERYNPRQPRDYDITKIKTPVRIYHGQNDKLADSTDTRRLYEKLSAPLGLVQIENFNHVDFIWAKDIDLLLINQVVRFIKLGADPQNGEHFIAETIRSNKRSSP